MANRRKQQAQPRPTAFTPAAVITVSPERWRRLQAALAEPAQPIPALVKLFADPNL